jgi:hypothetical protein
MSFAEEPISRRDSGSHRAARRYVCRIEQSERTHIVILWLTPSSAAMNQQDALACLHELLNRLAERLAEAERIRARFTSAHNANVWPELRSASRGAHIPKLPYFRPTNEDRTE